MWLIEYLFWCFKLVVKRQEGYLACKTCYPLFPEILFFRTLTSSGLNSVGKCQLSKHWK